MSADKFMSAAEIHVAVNWVSILRQLGVADEYLRDKHGPCPACGGVDRFRFDNRNERGDYICGKCGAGDGFSLLQRVHGWDFTTAREHVLDAAGLATANTEKEMRLETHLNTARAAFSDLGASRDAPSHVRRKLEWSTTAETIWSRTQALRGTLGEIYLHSRNCVIPPPDCDLRYLPADGRYPPSLCAAVTDARTGKRISLHFTRLAADGRGKAGTDRDKLLLKGHRKAGGVIRLWPDESVTTGLALAEGIETALAAAHGFTPIWSTIDAGGLGKFPLLAGIEALTIFADNDAAGLEAADECARRWVSSAEVMIIEPADAGTDFADVLA